ncbi:MAG: PD-(D/E)XK nuclease family protein [Mailhella sp.]|nr:PD-(D/E)XK nuclease family protein [Mailhella sp.]
MQYELPNGYLSASALNCLLTCPRQYEFRYIYRLPTPPTVSMLTGTALHRTFEEYYRTAMTSAQRYSVSQAKELAVTAFEDVTTSEECYLTAEERSSAVSIVQDLTATYIEAIAKDIVPLAMEEQCVSTARCGVPLLAYIDLRRQYPDGTEGIADYKITARKWTPDKLVNSLQFNLYSMMTGIGDIEIHNLVKASPAKRTVTAKQTDDTIDIAPNLRLLRHYFDGSQAEHLETLIESAARLITSGIFMPCSLDAWCCNATWCGYWNICRGKAQAKTFDLAA